MKKKLVAVILSVVMITSLLTGCGGEKETPAAAPAPVAEAPVEDTETNASEEDTTDTDTTDTDEAEVEMVSDETFADLSEAYDALTELYNAVATVYNDSDYDVPEVKEQWMRHMICLSRWARLHRILSRKLMRKRSHRQW